MKKVLSLIFILSPFFAIANPSHSVIVPQSSLIQTASKNSQEEEMVIVDRLIQNSQNQLDTQIHLKELMIRFNHLKEAFVQGDESKKTASAMVYTAREILEIISDQHLEFHFSKDYLDELTLFSSIAGKNGIKRP